MKTNNIQIKFTEYDSINELAEIDKQLIEESKLATKNAYCPYSEFHVGAAVLLENGAIITGNNQENAAYPSGLCAERVALFYANAQYPDIAVKAIAISAHKSNQEFTNKAISPCGSCRQVIVETENRFKKPIRIILFGTDKITIFENAIDLLPLAFT